MGAQREGERNYDPQAEPRREPGPEVTLVRTSCRSTR